MASDEILLHVCCAPCSTVAVPYWRAEGLEPLALFVNPNVQPDTEYARRLAAMQRYAAAAGLRLIVDESSSAASWSPVAGRAGLDDGLPPTTAERCAGCLQMRLREAAWAAAARGLPRFATSLTLSPYQRHDLLVSAGLRAAEEAGVEFVYADLRRHYRRSVDESRRLALYRQKYCGCVASKWEAWHERRGRRRGRGRDAA